MMLKLVWYLVLCQTVLFCNAQPHPVTEQTNYIRDGENITLSCSGEINATVTWKFNQKGSPIVGVANNAVSKNPTKYSATYNGKEGVYTLTVHSFLEISDAGQYSCSMAFNFSVKKEVIFTVIEQDAQPYQVTEETKYIREGENITLSCSGEINTTVTWKFKQKGSPIDGVANNAVTKNSTKYSATYNGKDGVYTFTVHSFLEISDAGQYSCLIAFNFSVKKEVIFTVIEQATANGEKSTPFGGIIGGVTGGLVVILICIIVVLFMRRRRRSTKEKKSDVETLKSHGSWNLLYPDEDSTENPIYESVDVSAEPELEPEPDPDPLYNQISQ